MVFQKRVQPGGFEIIKEGQEQVMKINFQGLSFSPSIEGSDLAMSLVISKLQESPGASRIVLVERRNYLYNYTQTQMLVEIANLYNLLIKQKKVLNLYNLGITPDGANAERLGIVQFIINLMKSDPLGSYVELKRIMRDETIKFEKLINKEDEDSMRRYMSALTYISKLLEGTTIVKLSKNYLPGYNLGDRSIYAQIFKPSITPDFMLTRMMFTPPMDGEELDIYKVGEATVTIFKQPGTVKTLYFLEPPEFTISEDKYILLDMARNILAEHRPREEEFLDPEKLRNTFYNIGKDLLLELAESKNIDISYEEILNLAGILVRYTIGFGLIEILLQDPKIQDISINGPIGETPIFIVHQDYDDCVTNIYPSREDSESWGTKFRLLSGRPLDEANPVLDTELEIPGARARTAIISAPLNPYGLGFSFRRHRDKPWTLPLFCKVKMMNSLSAGLISFLTDGSRTMLVAGTRSSGKTSLLGAVMVGILRRFRVITVEDTLELPGKALRDLGYNIQQMKVRSALVESGSEMSADEGIRASLRLGDSALVVGEVRSKEAFALYEAMRVGALANVVAGTIHGDSPYGVYDRVVNDLKVPATSFKATDIIIVANPMKSPDGMQKWRRVVSITEVRKHWEQDPLREQGFVDLMKYNPNTDELEPTAELINGNSEILKSIAGNVKEWAGNWDAIWHNIELRGKIFQAIVDYSTKLNKPEMLEAEFVIKSNDMFHLFSEEVKNEFGELDSRKIFFRWHDWLKRELAIK
ncbi:type II/IV secretion system ATPase subunit [Candidatus Woesearchaeota archaeon]|nr:type II/IV secretion system ATPase subunit [Candidatus Woesearchaeota archaeon]